MTSPRIGVGAVIVDGGALVMIERGKEPLAGLWSLPGGSLESGERLRDAVVREVLEETALSVRVGPLAGVFESPGDPHFVVLDYFAAVTGGCELVPGGDAADARWVPLAEVESLDCTPLLASTLRAWGVTL